MKCKHCNSEVSEGTNFCPNCGNRIELPKSLICPQCNTEVAEGTKFCPNCGSPIELPKPLLCPQCNTEVADGTKFCPNCGSPIGSPQPKKCKQCGTELEEGEMFCSNCGAPVNANNQPTVSRIISSTQNGNSSLKLIWKGANTLTMWKSPIKVIVDGKEYGKFNHKEPFEVEVPIVGKKMKVELKFQMTTTVIDLELTPSKNYECYLHFSGDCMGAGVIAYSLHENNQLTKAEGDVSMGLQLLLLIIPLLGYFYYFMKKSTQPIEAKVGLIWGLTNTLCIILYYLIG